MPERNVGVIIEWPGSSGDRIALPVDRIGFSARAARVGWMTKFFLCETQQWPAMVFSDEPGRLDEALSFVRKSFSLPRSRSVCQFKAGKKRRPGALLKVFE